MGILTPPQTSAPDPIAMAATAIIAGIVSQFQAMADAQQAGYNALFGDQTKTLAIVTSLEAQGCTLPMLLGSAQIAIQAVQAAAVLDGGTAPAMPTLSPGWTITMDSTGQIPNALVPPPATPPTGLTATAIEGGGATITWQPVVGALSYWLEKSMDSGATWLTVSNQIATSFTDESAVSGNQYQVRSFTAAGYSSYSAAISVP